MRTTITIRTEKALREELEKRAEADGKTLSEFIREILGNAVTERPLGARVGHLKGRLTLPQRAADLEGADPGAQLEVMKTWLVDTGPLVAYLDAGEDDHEGVAACLSTFTGRLATTGAVITEAMHFVSGNPDGPDLLAEIVAASGMNVYDLCQPREIRSAATLMRKYADLPMDFADATLVLLAEALGVHDILTLDVRGFSVFRVGRRAFRLVYKRN